MTPRSTVIERSLRCFDYGITSLIPGLGVLVTPLALLDFKFAIIETNDRWNPARPHLYAGAALALLSLLAHTIAAAIIFLQILRAAENV